MMNLYDECLHWSTVLLLLHHRCICLLKWSSVRFSYFQASSRWLYGCVPHCLCNPANKSVHQCILAPPPPPPPLRNLSVQTYGSRPLSAPGIIRYWHVRLLFRPTPALSAPGFTYNSRRRHQGARFGRRSGVGSAQSVHLSLPPGCVCCKLPVAL